MSAYNQITSQSLTNDRHQTEQIRWKECVINLRCVEGPEARELFLSCQAVSFHTDAEKQAKAIYFALRNTLKEEGGSLASIISETIFMRDLENDLGIVRKVRKSAYALPPI